MTLDDFDRLYSGSRQEEIGHFKLETHVEVVILGVESALNIEDNGDFVRLLFVYFTHTPEHILKPLHLSGKSYILGFVEADHPGRRNILLVLQASNCVIPGCWSVLGIEQLGMEVRD